MNCAEAVEWLYTTQFHGIKLGLDNVRRLLDLLGVDPARKHFLHVAGTNGKGSVCAMLDAICRAQGFRTGLFTSPHLIHFNERIRVDGESMPEARIAEDVTRLRAAVESWETHPTFFELTTAIALSYFQDKKTEVTILETGLGGRLDATNVVTPSVSILTVIDLDHETWLGHSLAEIATEKAGIIKAGIPAVSAPQHPECEQLIRERATALGTICQFVDGPWPSAVNLAGSHQRWNAALAVAALRASGLVVSEKAITEGLANVSWPGRFQSIDGFTIDGAHNPAAAQRLVQTWRERFGNKSATIVFAAMRDKDVTKILAELQFIAAEFVLTSLQNPRAANPDEIAAQLRQINPAMPYSSISDLSTALQRARQSDRQVLVTGSLFLAGETLALLANSPAPHVSTQ